MELDTNPLIDVDARDVGSHTVVAVTGELDAYTSERFRRTMLEQSQAGRHTIVVDLSGLSFTDSSGLGVLVGAFKRAKARGGAVCLLSPSDQLVKLLTMTGLTRIFPIFEQLQDALDLLDTMRVR